MATIIIRGNKHCVVYSYTTREGGKKQKWETYNTESEANKRKLEVELEQMKGTLFVPSEIKFEKFFYEEYVPTYAKSAWKYATYDTNMGLFRNHILPAFGNKKLIEIKPHDVEKLYSALSVKKVITNAKTPDDDQRCLSSTTIRYVHNLLKKVMSKAVEWQFIQSSPVICAAPEVSTTERSIWEPENFSIVLDEMGENTLLHLAVHLSFRATLRAGETVALTWDCVDFSGCKITINKNSATSNERSPDSAT